MTSLDGNCNVLPNSLLNTENTSEEILINNENVVKKRYENIQKPLNDRRQYRGLILNNDMKVLLISDSETDESAAALNINIGVLNDPDNLPGLAHFCEHVLLCGSEKYPDPNEYTSYLSEHGGESNASTVLDCTNYYFSITSDNFKGALDRFAQCFLNPLFNEASMNSELSAIDSEHKQNVANDSWRMEQLDASSANLNHPYSKFGTGNKETLDTIPKEKGINVRESLLKFYGEWYSANIMALSILGKESLDDLEEMVVKMFSSIENKKINAPEWLEHPFNENQFKHKWYVVPVKDVRVIKIVFPLPDLRTEFRAGVEIYICHLLNHAADGSLLSVLKKAGWCSFIISGKTLKVARGCNFLLIGADITEEGIEHIDDIITTLFQYLNMMRKIGPVEWLFNEYQKTAQLDFNFQEQTDPQSCVISVAQGLQNYPFEEILNAPYLLTEWRPDLINSVMDYLIPQNIRVFIASKTFKNIATESEFWYKTKYLKEKIPDDVINKWCNAGFNDKFEFPTKNEFIPTCFDIKANENSDIKKYPIIIKNNPMMCIWFKQDDEYRTPKINLTLYFENPIIYLHPADYNCIAMFTNLVTESLIEYNYQINIAGLNWDVDSNNYGFSLTMDGYNDKFNLILEKIMNKIVNFTVDKERFEIIKDYYIKSLENFTTEQPCSQATHYLDVLLADQYFTNSELLEATKYLTVERLEKFIPEFFSKLHVEGLIHGNITKTEALEIIELIEHKLMEGTINIHKTIIPLIPKQLLLHRQICLEQGCSFLYKIEQKPHEESCICVYYQCGLQSTESNIHLELLEHIITQPCYDYLRTKEQLGYNIFIGIVRNNGVQGLRIIVQGDKNLQFVEKKIDDFIESMLDYLKNLSDEKFNKFKSSLATNRLEKPKTMNGLFNSFLDEISIQQYNFDRDNIEVDYLKTVTRDQLVNFFKETIHHQSPISTKLIICVISTQNKNEKSMENPTKLDQTLNNNKNNNNNNNNINHGKIIINNIETFKASQCLFPLLKPFKNVSSNDEHENLS